MSGNLRLKAGELVEVRSKEEILSTLDTITRDEVPASVQDSIRGACPASAAVMLKRLANDR